MRASIALAELAELTQVQRFWYRIYVEEMDRHLSDPLTDHHSKMLSDPLAHIGNLFVARDNQDTIIATLMTTLASDGDLGKYERLYGIDYLDAEARARSSITTKLMVDPAYRNSRLPMLMARTAYEFALRLGVERDYIDCNDHLVSFFTRLGYKPHRGRIVHREYGAVNSMVIQLTDTRHLRQVGSPFLKSLQRFAALPAPIAEDTNNVAA
ncbi:MAG: hypothetical protein AAGI15_02470 [Pseudomonadota bacterium]